MMRTSEGNVDRPPPEPAVPEPDSCDLSELYHRHCELAGRLLQMGEALHALYVCVGLLDQFPPRGSGTPMRLLVEGVLRPMVRPEGEKAGRLGARLAADEQLRSKCLRYVERYLAVPGIDEDRRLIAEQVRETLTALGEAEAAPGGETSANSVPGMVRVAYLPLAKGDQAECRRLYVRVDTETTTGEATVGTLCPGFGAEAGRSYLEAAGAEPLEAGPVEVLIEGWFSQVRGESFALPIAVGMVSAHLGIAMPESVALTGALSPSGEPKPDGSDVVVLPVDAIVAKCEAAVAAGCRTVYIPEHVQPGEEYLRQLSVRGCEVVPVATFGQVLRRLFPQHAAAGHLEVASTGDMLRALTDRRPVPASSFQRAASLVLAGIVFERGFVGEYLVRPGYGSPGVALGACGLAALVVGATTWHVVGLPQQLPDERPLPRWGVASLLLGASFAVAWGLYHAFLPSVRQLPPPPHNQLWEHPSFQTFKDLSAAAFFASLFVISPSYLVQASERLRASGRNRWARQLASGTLARIVSGPVSSPATLAVVGACAIAALLPFDIISVLPGSTRYGAESPWQTIHVELRDLALSVAAAGFVAWFAGKTRSGDRASRAGATPRVARKNS